MAKFGIAPEWGSGGRWFKSSHSDQKSTCFKKAGAFFHRQSRTSGLLPLQSAARREIAAQRRSPRWFKSSHSDQKSTCFKKAGAFFHRQSRTSGLLPLQSAARREVAAQRWSPRWFKSSHSDQKSTCLKKQVLFSCAKQSQYSRCRRGIILLPCRFHIRYLRKKAFAFRRMPFGFYISGAKTRSTERSSRRKKEWSCASSKVIS